VAILEDAELLGQVEEGAGIGRAARPLPDAVPDDLLAERAGDFENVLVVDLVLPHAEQLRHHHVLEGHDVHRHGVDVELIGTLEHLVVDRAARRLEDDVDEHVAVPGLVEPLLGRLLDAELGRAERLEGALVKGFVGGFPDSELPDFGEPSLRRVYAETTQEVEALDAGLEEIEECPVRIALLHYSPTTTTLEGEPRVIWAFLGSDRLAGPIAKHKPDLVVHGHGHMGTFEGAIGEIPVYNVAQEVIKRDFWVFELG
jgi:hypothetical protein